MFSRGEGEICPRCSDLFERQFRRSIFDDPAGLLVAVILIFVSGALGYFFST